MNNKIFILVLIFVLTIINVSAITNDTIIITTQGSDPFADIVAQALKVGGMLWPTQPFLGLCIILFLFFYIIIPQLNQWREKWRES